VVADGSGGVLVGHEIVALDQLQSPRAQPEQGAGSVAYRMPCWPPSPNQHVRPPRQAGSSAVH